MENEFLEKVEDNAGIRIWSEKTQLEKGDSLAKGCTSEFYDYTRISVTQNDLWELKEIWNQWDEETNQLFYGNYGDLPHLLDIKIDEHLFRVFTQYWNPAYSCFTFERVDLVPTIEEYTALLRCPKVQVDKAYLRAACVPTFLKKLMNIIGMSEQWVTARVKQKGECKCISWRILKDLILLHPYTKRRVNVFVLSIYGLMVFPRALGYVDEAVSDLFDRFDRGVTPVPAILAETFRSLNACKRASEGTFIMCAQLLLAWFHSHFWKVDKVSYRVFSENYSPLKELATTPRRDDVLEENWIVLLQNLQEEDFEWRAHWLILDEILYRCGRIWGAVGYGHLLVLRQYRSRQFIPATHGLAQFEFSYMRDNYKKKVREISNAWKQTRRMKRVAVGPMTTLEYNAWWSRRINDNILRPTQDGARPMEEYLQIEQLEEEKVHLRLDIDVQKSEAEKLRKGKRKAEEDLDSLKTDYKKLHSSMRTAGLGKTSEQWCQEIQEEKAKVDQWKKRFHDAQAQKDTLKKTVCESQSENEMLRAQDGAAK
ncbi:myosin heavy chain-like [Gossypium australe]|uniref:Myosin heavy chain-like n=1 Tax=Gossypium australe TaxID=47621 RepID=A0A5B6X4J7_9ROSI|nr:myosin heavy chain-like [Gossypium australe]